MSPHVPTGDLWERTFPGEPFTTDFIPTPEQAAAVTALAEARSSTDLLPMLLGDGAAA